MSVLAAIPPRLVQGGRTQHDPYLIEANIINTLGFCARIYPTPRTDMFAHKLLSVALAFFWSALVVSCSYEKCTCTKPAIRREWRAFTTEEKADWIRAVNVRIDICLTLVVLAEAYSESSACHNYLMTRL
jgi:hypothetical protein